MFQPILDFIQFDFVKYMLMSEIFVCLIRIVKCTMTGRMSSMLEVKR